MTAAQRKMAPASAVVVEMVSQRWRPHALALVAKLEIADALAHGPLTVAQLAERAGCHEGALYRVLHALAHDGVFSQSGPRTFAQNALSDVLRRDHPQSVRNTVLQTMSDWNQANWGRLHEAVQTGKPQFTEIYGKDLWAYFAQDNPEGGALFHGSMVELTRMTAPLLAGVYDFGQHPRLVDLGGGRGELLSILLPMFPQLKGVLYDLEDAISGAQELLSKAGVSHRCEVVAGNIMESIPKGYEAYLMKHIVHGFDDERLGGLFEKLREAIRPGATLLIAEMLVPEGKKGVHPAALDLQMLVGAGGQERTGSEYARLLGSNGFRIKEIHRTPSPMALIVSTRN